MRKWAYQSQMYVGLIWRNNNNMNKNFYNMDYEKKYKEALERAREVIKNNPDFVRITPQLMGEIFPELAESEDERIKKNLIELFHDTVSNDEIFSDYGLDKTEVLAWLEKQEKPKWSEEDEEELEIAIETLHEAGQHSSAIWLKSLKKRMGGEE